MVAQLLGLSGDLERARGDLGAAQRRYADGLELSRRQPGDQQLTVSLLVRIAGLAAARGAAERSARLFGVVHGWHEAMGLTVLYQPQLGYERDEEVARAAVDPPTFARAWAEGRAMTLDQAVEYALGDEG